MSEEWRDVPGWEGFYQVSDLGRVRSLDRVIAKRSRSGGVETRRCPGRVLRPVMHVYPKVTLASPERREQHAIHALVLRAFVGPPPPGAQACHRDDVRHNNALANLRWGSPAENVADAARNDRRAIGERHGCAVLTEADVRAIRRSGVDNASWATRLGVTPYAVWAARVGRTWKHVT